MPVVIGIVALIAIIAIWFIGAYNALVRLKAMLEEAFSGMDVFLKKRYDLIPNLVETVKGYASHEQETLDRVISARNMAVNPNASIDERVQNEQQLTGALNRLLAIVEQYPNLKADSQFLNLQSQLSSIENEISQSRKYYNGAARGYNTKIAVFPSNIVANMSGFKKAPYFEVESDAERQNVKVDFSK